MRGTVLDKDKIPKHVAIIMDPTSHYCFAQTGYSAVSRADCFDGREVVLVRYL